MIYLLGGFAVLSGFLMLVYLFVNADPARLARGLKVTGIVIAVLAVATLAVSGRLAALLMPLAMLMPALIRVRSLLDRYRPPSGGQTSRVETDFLRMTLDHDTGRMEGTILRGRFAGMRLDELAGGRGAGGSGGRARPTSGGDMTVEEAYAILGLSPGADAEAIKEAHRRLMVKLHPDHGGSDYLATKINRARDVLLHH